MKEDFSVPIESCSTGFNPQEDKFVDESGFDAFTFLSCLSVPSFDYAVIVILITHPLRVLKHRSRRQFFLSYHVMFIALVFSSSLQSFFTYSLRNLIDAIVAH